MSAVMPTGLTSGIFKDAKKESSEAAEEQSAALFKCTSNGFMASHVVTLCFIHKTQFNLGREV